MTCFTKSQLVSVSSGQNKLFIAFSLYLIICVCVRASACVNILYSLIKSMSPTFPMSHRKLKQKIKKITFYRFCFKKSSLFALSPLIFLNFLAALSSTLSYFHTRMLTQWSTRKKKMLFYVFTQVLKMLLGNSTFIWSDSVLTE